jgi:hypothetical protein
VGFNEIFCGKFLVDGSWMIFGFDYTLFDGFNVIN